MARYIDADAAIRLIEMDALLQFGYTKRDAIDCIKATPTADVVPKSEVDEMKIILATYALRDRIRIFEEIEEIFNKRVAFYTDMAKQSKFTEKHYAETMIKNCEIYLQEIAELKKKYTEGET